MRTSDREKFIRLANKRVNRAIKALHLIGNLSNKSNYDYTEEDVSKIFAALKAELERCEERFRSPYALAENEFRLE